MSKKKKTPQDPFRYWQILPETLDSHCHLKTMARKGLPLETLIPRFFQEGGRLLLDIGTDETGWETRLSYSQDYPGRIFHTAGIHPTSLTENPETQFEKVLQQTWEPPVIAWGEIGLDYHHRNVDPAVQRKWFIRQLEAADARGLPVIIHNREADQDLFEILEAHPPRCGGILHCFSSGPREAERALQLGLLLGINGNSTYKGSEGIRQAIRETPLNCLVPDTDAPYLSPLPARGQPNHFGHIHLIYRLIAEIKGVTAEEAASAAGAAFTQLFPETERPPA